VGVAISTHLQQSIDRIPLRYIPVSEISRSRKSTRSLPAARDTDRIDTVVTEARCLAVGFATSTHLQQSINRIPPRQTPVYEVTSIGEPIRSLLAAVNPACIENSCHRGEAFQL
jgi:hypothetical protein